MSFLSYQRSDPRLPAVALVVISAVYLLAGITGHDPWKSEDVIHIAVAYSFATEGNWLVPRIAGEAWPHTAPLYHWVAAILGRALQGILPFHDAARLATPFFGAIFLFAIAQASRLTHGRTAGQIAPLIAIGTLGLLLPLHEAQPAIAGLACAALAFWGSACLQQKNRYGSLWLGLGIGLAFPAHGLAGLVMVVAALAIPLFQRNRKALLLTSLIAAPLLAAWPLMLIDHAPAIWQQWWLNEWAEASRARGLPESRHLEQILWATWPALPLALWSAWLMRRQFEQVIFPILGILITVIWYLSGSARLIAMLPVIPPLILLAAAGTDKLRRGSANAFDWFAIMTFSFTALLIWLGASAQTLGWPSQIARNFEKLAPGYSGNTALPIAFLALMATGIWVMSWRLPRASWRPSLHWAMGTTLMWGLVAALWLGWIDHGKSYRHVAMDLSASLPDNHGCIERADFGTPLRASLDYFSGIRTVPAQRGRLCEWRLLIADRDYAPTPGWTEHWRGNRPSDRKERWILERRAHEPVPVR